MLLATSALNTKNADHRAAGASRRTNDGPESCPVSWPRCVRPAFPTTTSFSFASSSPPASRCVRRRPLRTVQPVGIGANNGNQLQSRLPEHFVGAEADSAASSALCRETAAFLALAPQLAAAPTDSWLFSPLLNTVFQIPTPQCYQGTVGPARAACGDDTWKTLVVGYRGLFKSLNMWGDLPARLALLYPSATGVESAFYVDADRQTRLLQARDKLHTMSDALRGQLNGLNRLIADTVARVRHQAPAVARQQEMRCVHVSAARPGGSRAAIQWAS